MEKQDISYNKIEESISELMNNLKSAENLANDLENQSLELAEECSSKKSFLQTLQDNFNYDRNDLRTFTNIQQDLITETYIKQLENTLELVMCKYRSHTQSEISNTKLEFDKLSEQYNEKYNNQQKSIDKQAAIINGLVTMMDDFLLEGNAITNTLLEENSKLRAENKALRKILQTVEKDQIKDVNNNVDI